MRVSEAPGRFVAAVEAIYDAALEPGRWPAALQTIADVSGDIGSVLIWQRDDRSFGTSVSPSLRAAQIEYEREWWRQDMLSARLIEGGYVLTVGDVATPSKILTATEMDAFQSHPFYTDFWVRHGLGRVASVGISPDPHVQVWIAVQRSFRKLDFSEAEQQCLGQLGRHAEKSLRLSIRLLDAQLANAGLGEALTRIGIGVFALDSLGRVVFKNPAAERLCGDSIALVNDRLRIGAGAERAAIDAAIGRTLQAEPKDLVADPKPILVPRTDAERPFVIYLLPVGLSGAPTERFLTHTRAIVLVIDSQSGEPADPAVVRDALGLTLGEARVAALVGFGLPPREVAERLGIGEETARTTLKRVFAKVGVSRQSELAALLTKLVLR